MGAALCVLIACFAGWCFHHGYTLYWGDAQSHLNLSRGIIDSRTPGYDQLGNVWLPMLHVICLPLVANNSLWSTGLAGTIPVALCFAIAGVFLYLAARTAYESRLAASIVVSCFALNPNILYLASIPMTEMVFLAGLAVLLFAIVRFRKTQNNSFIALGVFASWFISLTRYDGWFLIPFAALAFGWGRRFLTFACVASLAPLYWIAHNWWETGNALDFYNGPYSAMAIQGNHPYPGYHNWPAAIGYYAMAGQLCSGWPLAFLGIIGLACLIKVARPLGAAASGLVPTLFLCLTPAFYIWSIHSSGNPIYVPQLWPHGYYNTRYGIAVVVLAAFAAGAIGLALPPKWKKFAAVLPLLSIAPWLIRPSIDNWICWKESQQNSISRRAWTKAGAAFLAANYHVGQGILTPSASDDIAGIFCRARIPLQETINVGNGPTWFANTLRPDLVHQQLWAITQAGDELSREILRGGSPYHLVQQIDVTGAPPLLILKRGDE